MTGLVVVGLAIVLAGGLFAVDRFLVRRYAWLIRD